MQNITVFQLKKWNNCNEELKTWRTLIKIKTFKNNVLKKDDPKERKGKGICKCFLLFHLICFVFGVCLRLPFEAK